MATGKRALGICDVCGFRYRLRDLRKNSYGLMVCPEDYEGQYDRKNHPQNKSPIILTDESWVKNARPERVGPAGGRNRVWETTDETWESLDVKWESA